MAAIIIVIIKFFNYSIPLTTKVLMLICIVGRKRFHENAVASYDEPNAKKQNSSDCSRQITAGFFNNSATRSAKLKSVRELSSPSKVRKRTNKAGKPPKSPARCSLPRSNQAWPSPGENVHRTRRGGELSKEFQVGEIMLDI